MQIKIPKGFFGVGTSQANYIVHMEEKKVRDRTVLHTGFNATFIRMIQSEILVHVLRCKSSPVVGHVGSGGREPRYTSCLCCLLALGSWENYLRFLGFVLIFHLNIKIVFIL